MDSRTALLLMPIANQYNKSKNILQNTEEREKCFSKYTGYDKMEYQTEMCFKGIFITLLNLLTFKPA